MKLTQQELDDLGDALNAAIDETTHKMEEFHDYDDDDITAMNEQIGRWFALFDRLGQE